MKDKKLKEKKPNKFRLPGQFYTITFRIVSYMFILMIITLTIALGLFALMYYGGVFDGESSDGAMPVSPLLLAILLVLVSAIIGCALSVAFYSLSFKELNNFRSAMHKVAKGDFTVTLPDSEESYMHELNGAFNAMVRSLRSIETLKTDFISDFSHEFKTPISSICGFAKLLKNQNLSEEEKREYVDIIIAESERLSRLSKNALSISKLENSDGAIEKKTYRLDEQLRKCVLLFQTEADGKQIDLSLSGEDVTFYGNEELLQQLWINLIGNAVKFTPEHGSIAIDISSGENVVRVSVSDTGCGMDEITKKRIFDKFWQADSSRTTVGNGLGLAIAKKIVDLSGGNIEVASEIGKGSTFTVVLPKIVLDEKEAEKKNKGRESSKTVKE